MNPRTLAIASLLALVVVASAAADDVEALRRELATTEAQLEGDARALKALDGYDPKAGPAWRTALGARRDLLKRLIAAEVQVAALAASDALTTRRDEARKALEAVRAASAAPLPNADAANLSQEYDEARKLADNHEKAHRKEQETGAALAALRLESSRSQERVAELEKAKAEPVTDAVGKYRQTTIQRELDWIKQRTPTLPDLIARVAIEHETTQLTVERIGLEQRRQQARILAIEERVLRVRSTDALRAERDVVSRIVTQLEAGKLDDVRGQLEGFADSDQAEWLKACQQRVAALGRLLDALERRAKLPSDAALAARATALTSRADTLRARDASKVELDAIDAAALARLEGDVRAAEAAEQAAAKAVQDLASSGPANRTALDEAIKTDAARRKQLDEIPPAAHALDRYRLRTLVIETVAVSEELAIARQTYEQLDSATRAAQLEREIAKLEVEYRRQVHARAGRMLASAEAARAEATRLALQRAREAAQLERDPIERFRKEARVELLELRQAAEEERSLHARLVIELQLQRPEPTRLKELHGRLSAQLTRGRGLSTRAVQFVLRTLAHYERRMQTLVTQRLPETRRQLGVRHAAQSEIAERLWQLQRSAALQPVAESVADPQLEALVARVDPSRRAEALAAYRAAAAELLPALEARGAALAQVVTELDELHLLQEKTVEQLQAIQNLVSGQIYWIKNASAIDRAALRAATADLARTSSLMTAAWTSSRENLSTGWSWLSIALVLCLSALLAAWRWPATPGTHFAVRSVRMPHLMRLIDGVLVAAMPPILILLAAHALERAEGLALPLRGPLGDVLQGAAALVFARRMTRWSLTPGGYVETLLHKPREFVVELGRASNAAIALGVLVGLPWLVLQHEALQLTAAPRLLYSIMLPVGLFLLAYLLRPSGQLATSATASSDALRRGWVAGALAVDALFLVMVGMDWSGYRAGSALLASATLRIVVIGSALALAYAVLVRSARLLTRTPPAADPAEEEVAPLYTPTVIPRDHATEDARRAYEGLRRRPPRRALPGAIAADAKDQSLEPGELARFVGVLVILGGIALAAWWFELGPRTRRITDGLPLLMGLTLWDLIAASAWLVAGHLALAYLPLALALLDAMLGRQTETTDTRYVAATLGRYALLIVAYGGALLSLNISPTNIAWLVTALSVGIGFGLQEIVANFISGIILLLERPVRVGDWVTIGSHTGIVQRINIRATVIQNFDRQVIVLPNKALITGEVNNWTLGDRMMRRTFLVGLAYGSDVGRFLQVVQELLDAHPDIATDPAPYVTFERFADSCLEFRVRFLAEVTLAVQVVSELHDMIHRRLGEEDITIAFPQLDLHIKGPLPESNR